MGGEILLPWMKANLRAPKKENRTLFYPKGHKGECACSTCQDVHTYVQDVMNALNLLTMQGRLVLAGRTLHDYGEDGLEYKFIRDEQGRERVLLFHVNKDDLSQSVSLSCDPIDVITAVKIEVVRGNSDAL